VITNIFSSFSQLSSSDTVTILTLILLEGLLSADNALVIAVLVKDLRPEHLQRKATKVGILFAYIVRFFAVFFGGAFMHFSWVKWGAATYLLWIAGKGLLGDGEAEDIEAGAGAKLAKRLGLSAFVQAIIAVELADVAFSVDSITAALAFSNKLAVVFIGGCLGILAMRFAAGVFLSLIQKFPILEKTAFVLVGIIGIKLWMNCGAFPGFGGLDWVKLNFEVPEWAAMSLIFGTFFGAIALQKFFPNSVFGKMGRDETEELKEEIDMQNGGGVQ